MLIKQHVLASFLLVGGGLIFLCQQLNGQSAEWPIHRSLLGNTGMIFTPSANINPDRNFSVGFSYIPERFSQLERNAFETGDKVWFVDMGFLPFLELTVRITKPSGSGSIHGIGDRSIFARVILLREKNGRPAVAVGVHDPFGNGNYHSLYGVLTKHLTINQDLVFTLNAGYGNQFLEAFNEYLIGPFGGVAASWKFFTLVAEYDADRINSGFQVNLFQNRLSFQVAMLGMRSVTGGVSAQFRL